MASCGQQSGDAGSSLFDWLIPSAHAGPLTCVISAGGKNFSVTPELALTCLGTFNGFAIAATSAAGAAASRLLPALSFFLDPTTVGAPVDKTQTLPDGIRIHVTGQQDELARHVLVTLPNGQQTELVLTTGDNKHYNLIAGMVLGAQMPPSMLAEMAATLSSGNFSVVYSQKAGMGHNGGPPLDEEVGSGNSNDPNNGKPKVPPPVSGGNGETKGPVYKTNKEAKAAAESLGYQKINETVHGGQPVYKKGNFYITRDMDGHNGGAWKMAKSVRDLENRETRLGTFDKEMNLIGK